jgi:hypothetical protein
MSERVAVIIEDQCTSVGKKLHRKDEGDSGLLDLVTIGLRVRRKNDRKAD